MAEQNPPTKDNLESAHFLSFSPAVRARLTACLRSDPAHLVPFGPPSEAVEAVKRGLNKVQPKNPPMKVITDPPNEFGQSMADAVLAYKSNNAIIRAGQRLDNVVGRMTLARLDTELANQPAPKPPPPPEFGSTSFRFTFFCNKEDGVLSRVRQYELFVASADGKDSGSFKVDQPFTSGTLRSFRGQTRGVFPTAKKVLVKRFGVKGQAVTSFRLTKLSGRLQGVMNIQLGRAGVPSTDPVLISFVLPRFVDENPSLLDGDGVVDVNGELAPRR